MRQWVYDILKTVDGPATVKQGGAVISATPKELPRPFLVYHMGNATDEGLWDSEDNPEASRQFLTVYVHDNPADYSRIDEIVEKVIKAMVNSGGSVADRILMVNYLETSRDFDDQTLKTIHRYIRFQLIKAGER